MLLVEGMKLVMEEAVNGEGCVFVEKRERDADGKREAIYLDRLECKLCCG